MMNTILVGWHLYPVCCATNFIDCACLSESDTSYVYCLLVFRAVHGTVPHYLRRSNSEDTARSWLRSAAHGDLQVPRSKTNFGDRAFAVTGPASWNRLPATIRSSDTLPNLFQEPTESSLFLMDRFFLSFHSSRTRVSLTAPKKLTLYYCYYYYPAPCWHFGDPDAVYSTYLLITDVSPWPWPIGLDVSLRTA